MSDVGSDCLASVICFPFWIDEGFGKDVFGANVGIGLNIESVDETDDYFWDWPCGDFCLGTLLKNMMWDPLRFDFGALSDVGSDVLASVMCFPFWFDEGFGKDVCGENVEIGLNTEITSPRISNHIFQ